MCTDWKVRNGICYKKFESEMGSNTDWDEAVDLCKSENAYLAEIPNIYVNNIITDEIIEGEQCWIGLKTSDTEYYWRIGNFPLSAPNSGVTVTVGDRNRCGTIGRGEEDRWRLSNSNCNRNRCYVCMKGKQSV